MTRKITEADVLEAYRAARGLGRTEFAHELGMSKQSYSSYVNNGARQDLAGLQEAAVEHVGTWIGDLCVDLLTVRGAAVPCVCQTAVGDRGLCPKHPISHPYPALPVVSIRAKSRSALLNHQGEKAISALQTGKKVVDGKIVTSGGKVAQNGAVGQIDPLCPAVAGLLPHFEGRKMEEKKAEVCDGK